MKICAIADTHGWLPDIPPCDLLLIAGDICPDYTHDISFQRCWLKDNFKPWAMNTPAKNVVIVAGNHDFFFERDSQAAKAIFVSERKPQGLTYLQDDYTVISGLKVWGSPWQLPFHDWAFNAPENKLESILSNMPLGIDIIVSHGPPYGYGDLVPNRITDYNEEAWPEGERTGSKTLLKKIDEVKPKLCVFGHIHEGRGEWQHGPTKLANVTMVDAYYRRTYRPWIWEL